ncbi:MAG TPA: hypothetical protein VG738_22840 [Chitinophagaceae bacterium]|nr:hypothetical protein [Chitinophagaceae bacterium]
MKKYAVCFAVVAAVAAGFSCFKTATGSLSQKSLSGSLAATLLGKWQYTHYLTCPPNPMMEAPCYEYEFTSDTARLFLDIGESSIYRSQEGASVQYPISWVYGALNDTSNYKVIDDSTFTLLNAANEVIDTVKIKTADEHSLVLYYISKQSGTTFQQDNLIR